MVESLGHPVGTFCFMESASVDVKSSHRFYGSLFGWDVKLRLFPEGGSYTRFLMRDLPVAEMYSVEADQDVSAVPAQWLSYVSVDNAVDVLTTAVALGAVPFGDVVDVPGMVSVAEFVDPAGALCGVWQAETHIGASFIGEPGTLTWTDLATPDPSAAAAFYGELFGWTVESVDMESGTYGFFTSEGTVRAGLTRSGPGGIDVAPSWRSHVGVSDLDAAAAVVANLGGGVRAEASNPPGLGRRATVKDPNGVSFMLIEAVP